MVKQLDDVAKERSQLRIWKDDAVIEFKKHERAFKEQGEEIARLNKALTASNVSAHSKAVELAAANADADRLTKVISCPCMVGASFGPCTTCVASMQEHELRIKA